jgi:hypothetical protein
MSRIRLGSSVTSMVTAALQMLIQWAQRGAERVQIIGARAEIVVDEDSVRLVVFQKLGGDLFGALHAVGHAQAVGGEIAEAAAVVASAGGDQAGGGEEAARGRIDRRGAGSSR